MKKDLEVWLTKCRIVHWCRVYEQVGTTMHFELVRKGGFINLSKTTYNYAIPFAGWTRTVGAEKARSTLKNLNLYDQF